MTTLRGAEKPWTQSCRCADGLDEEHAVGGGLDTAARVASIGRLAGEEEHPGHIPERVGILDTSPVRRNTLDTSPTKPHP